MKRQTCDFGRRSFPLLLELTSGFTMPTPSVIHEVHTPPPIAVEQDGDH